MNNTYLVSGLLLAIPTIVLLFVPLYNRQTPEFLGLPFFYWFQALWLFIAAGMYLVAARMLTGVLDKGEEA